MLEPSAEGTIPAAALQQAHPGLVGALRALTGCDAYRDGGQRLDDLTALTAFRVAQEATANAVRHGMARHVNINFHSDADQMRLMVRDDGCGFEVPASWDVLAAEGHFGLLGMCERAATLGGELMINSAPGSGTTVTLSIR